MKFHRRNLQFIPIEHLVTVNCLSQSSNINSAYYNNQWATNEFYMLEEDFKISLRENGNWCGKEIEWISLNVAQHRPTHVHEYCFNWFET